MYGGSWPGRGHMSPMARQDVMNEGKLRLDAALERSRSQMMMEGCLPRNNNQRSRWDDKNRGRGGRGRGSHFDSGQGSRWPESDQGENPGVNTGNPADSFQQLSEESYQQSYYNTGEYEGHTESEHNQPGSYPRGGKANNVRRISDVNTPTVPNNTEYNQPGSYPRGGKANNVGRISDVDTPTVPITAQYNQPGSYPRGGKANKVRRISDMDTPTVPGGPLPNKPEEEPSIRKKRRSKYVKEKMLTIDMLPEKTDTFLYKATYFPEYIDYVENVSRKKKQLRENDFAKKMIRLNAALPLDSLASSLKLSSDKLLSVEQLRNNIGNHKNMKAFCFFVRFLDPKDTTVRILECQLYIFNILIAKHRMRISRCTDIDLKETNWTRSKEYQRLLNDTFVKSYHTLTSKPAKTIVDTHKMLLEGHYPDFAFSQVVIGTGKHGNSNLAQMLRSRHPTKPVEKWKYEDFVLIEQSTAVQDNDKLVNAHNLSRSASMCGMLVEWKYTLRQTGKTNQTMCSIYLENELVAEAWDINREGARLRAADVAVLKLKRTHPIIVMFPKTKPDDVKEWDELVAEAEVWFAKNANEVNFPLLDAEIDVEISSVLQREAAAFEDYDVLRSDQDIDEDGSNQQESDQSHENNYSQDYQTYEDTSQDMELDENTQTESNPYRQFFVRAKKTSTFNKPNPALDQSHTQAPAVSSYPGVTSVSTSITAPSPSLNTSFLGMPPPPPPPPPSANPSGYPTSDTNFYTTTGTNVNTSAPYVSPAANTHQQTHTTNDYWEYNGQYYSYDEYGYCYLTSNPSPTMAASNAWEATAPVGTAASTGSGDLYSTSNPYSTGPHMGAVAAAYTQPPANSWPTSSQYSQNWPPLYTAPEKPVAYRAIVKAPQPTESPIDVAIKAIANDIATAENRKEALENQLKTKKNLSWKNAGVVKGRQLSDFPVEETGLFIHTKEPLLPLNKKVVLYIMHLVEQHISKENLEELMICANIPLAERQALDLLFTKHDCKLSIVRQKDKIFVSVLRWIPGQEMKAILKRNKNAIGKTVLISEGRAM